MIPTLSPEERIAVHVEQLVAWKRREVLMLQAGVVGFLVIAIVAVVIIAWAYVNIGVLP